MEKENPSKTLSTKVLVVGSGARENCLAWKLSLDSKVDYVYVSPGNGGSSCLGHKIQQVNLNISKMDKFADLCSFAKNQNISLVVIGPEQYLCDGITDALINEGICCFGPSASVAALEGSKVFSKFFMKRNKIPTANFEVFKGSSMLDKAINFVENSWSQQELVIKASGLAMGKGVIVPNSIEEAIEAVKDNLQNEIHGEASKEIIIEEKLYGIEVSILVLCNGQDFISLPASHDYKRLLNDDKGPNTGGMGAVCPSPRISSKVYEEILSTIIKPTINSLSDEGTPFIGCLYTGIMLTEGGPKVLEYNVRFGDPETQAILPCLPHQFYEPLLACTMGLPLRHFNLSSNLHAVSVVVAAQGYPTNPIKGTNLSDLGLEKINLPDNVFIFQAGTQKRNDSIVVSGGRVLTITATSFSTIKARELVYAALPQVTWPNSHHRTDIANDKF